MPTLEFTLDPADVAQLSSWSGMRVNRSYPTSMTWQDTPEGMLTAAGLALCATGSTWRLTPLRPDTASTLPPVQAEARRPELLVFKLPGHQHVAGHLSAGARFDGRRQRLRWVDGAETVTLELLDGKLGSRKRPPACRLTLDGAAPALTALAVALAQRVQLRVPLAGLAAEALAAARNEALPPRALGAPQVQGGQTVTESLAVIVGHLLDVMLHWAPLVPASRTPEAVHQMRVATRRLRSALSVFKLAAASPDIAALAVPLKICAARLGTARDWDVFIDGLGARLSAAFPDDPRCRVMMRAAVRRRRIAYADLGSFLAGPDFRTLTVALSCVATLRPWDATAPPEGLQQDTAVFAAGVLARRQKRVRQAGRDLGSLTIPALHELRKDCKRLRYAAEFFASLFPAKRTKRFLIRLSELQDELGLLNDGAAVSGLMAQLGRIERSYAAGLVEGFSAAHAGPARDRIEQAWKRFRVAKPFWEP